MWYMHEGMEWWMVIGGLWGLLVVVGIIAFIIWATSAFSQNNSNYRTRREARDIARERYARGEITREEYNTISKNIS